MSCYPANQKREIFYGTIVQASKMLKTNRIDGLCHRSKCIEIGGCSTCVKINGDLIVTGSNVATALATNDPNINVVVNTSDPPNPGQILVATSNSNAIWANAGAGSSGNISYHLSAIENRALETTYTEFAYFPWKDSLYGAYTAPVVIFEAEIGGNAMDFRIRGQTTGTLVEILNINASQFFATPLNILPVVDDRVIVEIRTSNLVGIQPRIFGLTLQFTQ